MSNDLSAPAPPPVRWWQNEDWLALIAALPLMVAVVMGWKVKLPKLGWASGADLGAVFSGDRKSVV
jgi:hypothetical protein